jgi:hypothetical protein
LFSLFVYAMNREKKINTEGSRDVLAFEFSTWSNCMNTCQSNNTIIESIVIVYQFKITNLRLEPVSQIPHAAPIIESPNPKATPKLANPYGDIWVKTSDHPWLQYSDVQVRELMTKKIKIGFYFYYCLREHNIQTKTWKFSVLSKAKGLLIKKAVQVTSLLIAI